MLDERPINRELARDDDMSNDDMGYLRAKVEGLEGKIDEHLEWDKEIHGHLDKRFEAVVNRLDALHDDVRTARSFLALLKLLGLGAISLITWRFDAFKAAWTAFIR